MRSLTEGLSRALHPGATAFAGATAAAFLPLLPLLLLLLPVAACGPGGGAPATYRVVVALSDSPADLATLHLTLGYDHGDFVGNGASVACALEQTGDGETATFVDDDQGSVDASIDATDNPLTAGTSIFHCDFSSTSQPIAADFTLTVLAATDDLDDPVAPADLDVTVTSTDLAPASLVVGSDAGAAQ